MKFKKIQGLSNHISKMSKTGTDTEMLTFYVFKRINRVSGKTRVTNVVTEPRIKIGSRDEALPKDQALKHLRKMAKPGEVIEGPFTMPKCLYELGEKLEYPVPDTGARSHSI